MIKKFFFLLLAVAISFFNLPNAFAQDTGAAAKSSEPVINNRVLVIEPCQGLTKGYNSVSVRDEVKKMFGNKNFTVDYRIGASIDSFKNLGGYGTIIIASHAGLKDVTYIKDGKKVTEKQVVISTGIEATKENESTYEELTKKGELVKGTISFGGNIWQVASKEYYGVTPEFFIDNDYNNDLHNSIIFAGACESAGNGTMAQAFYAKGASVYYGFEPEVHDGTVTGALNLVFSDLLNGKNISDAGTRLAKKYSQAAFDVNRSIVTLDNIDTYKYPEEPLGQDNSKTSGDNQEYKSFDPGDSYEFVNENPYAVDVNLRSSITKLQAYNLVTYKADGTIFAEYSRVNLQAIYIPANGRAVLEPLPGSNIKILYGPVGLTIRRTASHPLYNYEMDSSKQYNVTNKSKVFQRVGITGNTLTPTLKHVSTYYADGKLFSSIDNVGGNIASIPPGGYAVIDPNPGTALCREYDYFDSNFSVEVSDAPRIVQPGSQGTLMMGQYITAKPGTSYEFENKNSAQVKMVVSSSITELQAYDLAVFKSDGTVYSEYAGVCLQSFTIPAKGRAILTVRQDSTTDVKVSSYDGYNSDGIGFKPSEHPAMYTFKLDSSREYIVRNKSSHYQRVGISGETLTPSLKHVTVYYANGKVLGESNNVGGSIPSIPAGGYAVIKPNPGTVLVREYDTFTSTFSVEVNPEGVN